jgi:DNA-binding MarR family transcriptional regulator
MGNQLPPAVAERIGFLTGRLNQTVQRMVREQGMFGDELSGRHFGCLTVIIDEGPLSQQELGDRMRIDRTTIVSVVDELEQANLVERRRNPSDRRAYALEATAAGRQWQGSARKAVLDAERELLAPLSAPERKKLISLMQRVLLG